MAAQPKGEPVEVRLEDYAIDCDVCFDNHFAWKCPECGSAWDHYQGNTYPLDETCLECGTICRITEAEADRWEASQRCC